MIKFHFLGHEYVLVKKSEPGTSIDLEATLNSMQTLQFQLVKRTSIRKGMFLFIYFFTLKQALK